MLHSLYLAFKRLHLMLQCLVIDDDPVSISLIAHFISNTEGLELLESFTAPMLAANYLRKNAGKVDLIFLDVEMPEMSGLEFLQSFDEFLPVILITSKEKYAVKAFEHKVIHYLVKPIDYGKFLKAIQRVFKLYEGEKQHVMDYIFIKDNGVLTKVLHKEILFFEALGDYVKVHLKEKTHLVTSTMKNLEEKLKNEKHFVRIHRSYIINLAFLKNFDAETATINDRSLPIGSKYKSGLQTRLNII
jgi:two-component system, LytTR family, response regulator LytT